MQALGEWTGFIPKCRGKKEASWPQIWLIAPQACTNEYSVEADSTLWPHLHTSLGIVMAPVVLVCKGSTLC